MVSWFRIVKLSTTLGFKLKLSQRERSLKLKLLQNNSCSTAYTGQRYLGTIVWCIQAGVNRLIAQGRFLKSSHSISLTSVLMLSFNLHHALPNVLFLVHFATKIFISFNASLMYAAQARYNHPILSYLITLITPGR